MSTRARACFLGCAAAAVAAGITLAIRRSWMCDDAFITFRYADHLVRGHGLVFNAGERVEGFTNLLWTLWTALGLRFGASAEIWAGVSGIACFAATLALLARRGGAIARAAGVAWPLPAAAVLAAIHHEWTVFATSGLETSAFTLLALAGYLLVCPVDDASGGPADRSIGERPSTLLAGLARGVARRLARGSIDDPRRVRPEQFAGGTAKSARIDPRDGGAGGSVEDPQGGSVEDPQGGSVGDRADPTEGRADAVADPAERRPVASVDMRAERAADDLRAGLAIGSIEGRIAVASSADLPRGPRGSPRWLAAIRRAAGTRWIRLAAGGAVLALASLTRPDGALFAAVCGVWLLAGRELRGALAFAGGFAVLWLPVTIWRVSYYGDVFPNTYYAKSAAIAWWSQGWYYAEIYFARYWPLLLALPAVALARPRRQVALELALAGVYALYVMRVGGDFMFGRLLVPVTPFLLLAVERGLIAAAGRRPVIRAAAIAVLGAALIAMPSAVDGHRRPRGIADEHDAYTVVLSHWAERADTNGAALARLFDGLPVSVCFFGAQARLVYRSRVATAIECETGLTDATIAHQPLAQRGRIGHEKHAPLPYLLARHVDLVLTRDWANEVLHLDDQLPDAPIELGRILGRVITWDPAIMAALAGRGVRVPDVPAQIDQYIATMASRSDDIVRRDWNRFRRQYFDRVPDPARAAAFRARLGE